MPGDRGVVAKEDGGAVDGCEFADMTNAARTNSTVAITCMTERAVILSA
jgi:hypothetical protein